MGLIDKALCIAQKAHANQTDKAGDAYVNHPKHVASLVETEIEKATALLHDVLEDSGYSESDLLGLDIPKIVVDAVVTLTKKEGMAYEEYLIKVIENPIARKVKLADLAHNADISRISNPCAKDYQRMGKYKRALKFLA